MARRHVRGCQFVSIGMMEKVKKEGEEKVEEVEEKKVEEEKEMEGGGGTYDAAFSACFCFCEHHFDKPCW